MNASELANPIQFFPNLAGLPLDGGSIYIGQPNVNPVTNPLTVYQDIGLTIPMPQPLGTVQGSISLNGSPAAAYLPSGQYSMLVLDKGGNTVMSLPVCSPTTLALNYGQMTDYVFNSGVDYVEGTTVQLPIPVTPGSAANVWAYFAGVPQFGFTVPAGYINFGAPIPVGIKQVIVKVGQSVAVGTPGNGTVTDASVAAGSKLSNRINDFIDLRDPAYGAKCDGVTDDTTAILTAISSIGSNGATLLIPGPTLFSSNVTFGSNTVLWPINGGYLIGKAGTEVPTVQKTPFAGPVALFKNCAPVATHGMTVFPEWFGAVPDGGADCAPAFNAAFAFLKNTGGQIRMEAGTYLINETIVNNWSHIHLIGAGQNATLISMTSATLDGIQNFGVAGTPLANCSFREFGLVCSAAGSSTGSFGLNLQYNAFTLVENVQVQEFLYGINLLRSTNTQFVQVGATYVNGTTNGAICFNFNGGGTGTGGNASTTLRNCFASGNNTLTGSIGYKLSGAYMSDLFFDACETAGTNYGYYFDYSGASYYEDIQISRPIVDQWTAQGIFIQNMPVGGKLTVMGGWINPKDGANNGTTCVYVNNCQGNITVNGAQIVADANIANTTGVNIINSAGVTLSANQITNTHVGVLMSGSGYNKIVGNSFKNDASAAAYYISGTGDARTMVNGNSFEGFATVGVAFDATSSGSAVVGNTFRVTNIGTRVSNNATTPVGAADGSTGLNSGY